MNIYRYISRVVFHRVIQVHPLSYTFQYQHNRHRPTHNTFTFQTISNRAYIKLLRLIDVLICLIFISHSTVHGYAGNGKITFHPIAVHVLSWDSCGGFTTYNDLSFYTSGNLIHVSYFEASSVFKFYYFFNENRQV